MNDTNEIIKSVHHAILCKVAEKCRVDGNKLFAAEVAKEIGDYAVALVGAFSDDGVISEDESAQLKNLFDTFVDKRIPKKQGWLVKVAWEGLTIPGFGWLIKGWEGLRIKVERFLKVGIQ